MFLFCEYFFFDTKIMRRIKSKILLQIMFRMFVGSGSEFLTGDQDLKDLVLREWCDQDFQAIFAFPTIVFDSTAS